MCKLKDEINTESLMEKSLDINIQVADAGMEKCLVN